MGIYVCFFYEKKYLLEYNFPDIIDFFFHHVVFVWITPKIVFRSIYFKNLLKIIMLLEICYTFLQKNWRKGLNIGILFFYIYFLIVVVRVYESFKSYFLWSFKCHSVWYINILSICKKNYLFYDSIFILKLQLIGRLMWIT